LMQIFFLSLL